MMEYIRFSPDPYYSHAQYHQPHLHHDGIHTSFSGRTPAPRAPHSTSFPRPPAPHRSYTTHGNSTAYEHLSQNRMPWQHKAQTYAWVMEQEIAEMARQNEDTVRWVRRQQERDILRGRAACRVAEGVGSLRALMEDLAHTIECEDGLRASVKWRRETEKLVEEEIRRLHASRLEAERCKVAYERRRAQEDAKERRRREKERERAKACREQADREAWSTYEARWAALTAPADSPKELAFRTIPWPMFSPPTSVEDITPARVAMFLLSPLHPDGQSRKDRIKGALRKWHPDRFGRLLGKVAEDDKAAVEEGAGIVVRCLNNLLERES